MVALHRTAELAVASLNIRGVPVVGSRLRARCEAIGDTFEASGMDVVCLQEVLTYRHLSLLTRRMPSYRRVCFRRSPAGPAGGLVTLSRSPARSYYRRFPLAVPAGVPLRSAVSAALKGMLVARLPGGMCVVNVHPVANTDGDWSAGSRFATLHRRQLGVIADLAENIAKSCPVIVCGDFNVARASGLWQKFMAGCGMSDAFEGRCPPTFRDEYLPPGRTAQCIDFILVGGRARASSPRVILDGPHPLPGGDGYLSDHVGLSARVQAAPV